MIPYNGPRPRSTGAFRGSDASAASSAALAIAGAIDRLPGEARERREARRPALLPQLAESVDAALAWRAVMGGDWVVAEHRRDGASDVLIARMPDLDAKADVLGAHEVRVAMDRARGAALKEIAIDGGISTGVVVSRLASAMQKLGLRSEAELVAFFDGGFRDPRSTDPASSTVPPEGARAVRFRRSDGPYLVITYPAPCWLLPACLSRAERRVVAELIGGGAQHAIARACGVSTRTVANQLASIYRKLDVHGRLELFVAVWRAARRESGPGTA